MFEFFATGKVSPQAHTLPPANDLWKAIDHDWPVAKNRADKRERRPPPPLYLREWLAALGLGQGKIALQAGVNEGYVSQLVNREKNPDESPRTSTVQALADAMDVPWQFLFEPPPPDPVPMDVIRRYPPELLRRLASAKHGAPLVRRASRSLPSAPAQRSHTRSR